jgi:uroporphyrinogen-III synthase
MRVIVTRPESEAQGWMRDLRERGFDAVALPLLEIAPAPRPAEVAAVWLRLDTCRAVMFVSGNAVRHFFAQRPADVAWPGGTRAWATGNGTRRALLEAGTEPALVDSPPPGAAQFDSETLWREVAGQVTAGDRVLIVRGGDAGSDGVGRDWLAEQLRGAGAQVETVVAYVRAAPALSPEQLAQARQAADASCVWLFSSSQAIANLSGMLPGQDWTRCRALATHPRIAQAAQQAGFGVVCVSRPSLDAVTTALESFR